MSKEKVTLNASQINEKWSKNLKSAVSYIQQGIDRVTENPMDKAAANIDKMVAGIQRAAASGRIERGLKSVTLAEWKQKTKDKVGSRLAGGVDAAQGKHLAFCNYLTTTLNAILPTVNAMPSNTFEDSMNRIRTQLEYMKNNPYKG